MSPHIGFARQGELIKLAYDAFGVLPRKSADRESFDETKKKAIQKKLERLTKEEGRLASNADELIKELGGILIDYLPDVRIIAIFGKTMSELHSAYIDLVRCEGTYLGKAETLRYFISVHAVFRLVISLNKNLLLYRGIDTGLDTPSDPFWYLPSIEQDDTLTLPLAKVMRWAYKVCGSSQIQFHYPGKTLQSDDSRLQHNLDNADNWTSGVTLPALPALIKNFNDSFEAMAQCGREVPKPTQDSILTALVFARFSSYIARELADNFGVIYLKVVCEQFQEYAVWIAEDMNEFKAEMKPVMQRQTSAKQASNTWLHACADYWGFFLAKLEGAATKLQQLHDAHPGQPLRKEVVAALTSKYGPFAVRSQMDLARRQMACNPPNGFAEMLGKGFALKRDSGTQWAQIDQYANQVKAYGLEDHLCWMESWLRAVYHYRNEDFKTAMGYYQTAFDNAKYRAGKNQYDLVNQYVEVAAKNDKRQSFKKGVEWAQYLGIEIRWLRDDEPTDERLNDVYETLKMARYDHQM